MTHITINLSYIDPSTGLLESTPIAPPPFTPLFKNDFSSGTLGTQYSTWNSKSVYANDYPLGGRALKLTVDANSLANLTNTPSPICGGNHFYGGRESLPADVEIGEEIWVMTRRYIPSNFTWSYCYNTSTPDFNAATACSQNGDGNAWLKDLVLAPRTGTSRFYVQPAVQRRNIAQTANNRILCEEGPIFNDVNGILYPLNTEFTLQIYVKVSDTSSGIIRVWINNTLINSVTGANVTAANAIHEWGIGDYWNGVPFTDGTAALSQWIREVIIATSKVGYGAPTTTDSGGNVYIDPALRVSNF